MSNPNFFDGVDLDDPAAVQAASDAAAVWAEEEAARNFAALPPAQQAQVLGVSGDVAPGE